MRRRFILLSIAAILMGAIAYVDNSVTTQPVYSSEKPVEKQVTASPTPTPSKAATVPRQQNQTVVAAVVQPAKKQAPAPMKGNTLTISSIGFQGSIVDVGVTADNAIDVPVSRAGRWIGSAQPGTPGAVFLDGHVDGVFARLNKLTIGQTISMVYNNQTFNYKVVFSEVVDLAAIDMNRSLSVYGASSEGLNIMTCAGTYIPSAGTYDKRLVVYTVRV